MRLPVPFHTVLVREGGAEQVGPCVAAQWSNRVREDGLEVVAGEDLREDACVYANVCICLQLSTCVRVHLYIYIYVFGCTCVYSGSLSRQGVPMTIKPITLFIMYLE